MSTPTSTEITKQTERPVLAMLGKYKGQIEAVLPKHLTPTRVLKMIVGAINKNPKLLECTPMSVINAVLTASQLGLEISPGQAYLIPYGKECTLIVDYRGKIELAQRSGKVLDIDLEVVYSKEKFRIYRDENGHKRIEHEPVLYKEDAQGNHMPITEADRGVPIGAYAMAVLKEGPPKIVFMPMIDIEAIRRRSRSGDNGPWKTDPMEMWKKTVCHRICKTLPQSAELRDVQEIEDRAESGEATMRVIEVEEEDEVPMIAAGSASAAVETHAKTEALAEKLTAARENKVEPASVPAPTAPPVGAGERAVLDSWKQRCEDTFMMQLGLAEYKAVLHSVTGSEELTSVTKANKDAVWAAMNKALAKLETAGAGCFGMERTR